MKIVINDKSKNLEITSFDNLNNIHENVKKFSLIKCRLEVKFFAIDEAISSHKLSKLKNYFDKINVYSLRLYSNKGIQIAETKNRFNFLKEKELSDNNSARSKRRRTSSGDKRSGHRISSNGNLYYWR